MWSNLRLDPDPSQSGDWPNFWMTVFGLVDPHAEAKAFYGEEVFRRLYEQEQAQRDWALVRRRAGESGRLIDDVAGQLRNI
jgi:hypothetical protein